jgi:3-hydroxymyristoyl/3-hydroxydecanoyl-(acyl carrier protein) dehydratase
VDELPRDAHGKTSRAALESILRSRSGAARTAPILYEELRDAHRLQRRMEVPPDLAFLDGHFEGHPVVAGVVQVRWVMDAAAVLLGAPPRVKSLEALKFHSVLRPGDAFSLEVERNGNRLRFRLFDGDRMFSSGRCRLAPASGSKA